MASLGRARFAACCNRAAALQRLCVCQIAALNEHATSGGSSARHRVTRQCTACARRLLGPAGTHGPTPEALAAYQEVRLPLSGEVQGASVQVGRWGLCAAVGWQRKGRECACKLSWLGPGHDGLKRPAAATAPAAVQRLPDRQCEGERNRGEHQARLHQSHLRALGGSSCGCVGYMNLLAAAGPAGLKASFRWSLVPCTVPQHCIIHM